MQRTKPPFRADHVGSLLRPAALRDARAKRERGEIDAAALTAIEDDEIKTLIARQEAVGLKSITDGEYPPRLVADRFPAGARRHRDLARRPQDPVQGRRAAEAMGLARQGKARALLRPSADRALEVRRRPHQADREGHDPLPVRAAFPPGPRRRAGGDLSRHGGLLSRPRRALRQGGARLRRCRLPLSPARRGQPRLSVRSLVARAREGARRRSGYAAADLCRHDQCRDVGHSRPT